MLKYMGWMFSAIALGLFFPGILMPIFSLDMDMMVNVTGSSFSAPLIGQQLSILGTVEKLWGDQRFFVAILIFLFSVVVPLAKSVAIAAAAFMHDEKKRSRLLEWVSQIGKWSMADVFVVAIFLAVLSTQHADNQTSERFSLFGFSLDVQISTQTLSSVGEGFYFFVGYCIISLIGSQCVAMYHKTPR